MGSNLTLYDAEELLLIYKNQSRAAVSQAEISLFSSYDDYYNYYNYDNYNNYDDYHNYGDYSNYDQYSDSGCFITTAVCNTFGKPDNCRELMAFRKFRDTFMQNHEDLKHEIAKYYEIAPRICIAIDSKGVLESRIEYQRIWNQYLSKAYEALDREEYEKAYHIYKDMVLSLEKQYLN